MASMHKTILVMVGKNTRPVTFDSGSASTELDVVTNAIRKAFDDVLHVEQEFFLKVECEHWNGRFVNLIDGEMLVDKSFVLVELKDKLTASTEVGF